MARWAWGTGVELGRIDHVDACRCRLFDGAEEIIDYVDFVDEEAGVYRISRVEDPNDKGPDGLPKPKFVINRWGTDVVKVMKKAKARLKVFVSERP